METKEWLWMLKDIAFVLDGPLAVFGHPAWLSQAIMQELKRINQLVREKAGCDILLLGVEKSGQFPAHFDALDVAKDGSQSLIPNGSVGLLDDTYIKRNIFFSESDKPYGADTYFGRKFLYKTKTGAKIVGTLPFLNSESEDTKRADPSQFPRLPDALNLLDKLVSSRYKNSLSPLVSAHAEAAIPLNLGKRVLESLAKELIGGQ